MNKIRSIREQLTDFITEHKDEDGLRYKDLEEASGLNTTQITRILKHKGKGVSLESIEKLVLGLGYSMTVGIESLDDTDRYS